MIFVLFCVKNLTYIIQVTTRRRRNLILTTYLLADFLATYSRPDK